jgi:hypothetical protein
MSKKVPVDWTAFRNLVVSGLSIREVARRLGVNPNTALQNAARQKWDIADLHAHASQQLLERTKRIVQDEKDSFRQADAKTKSHLAQAVAKASETLNSLPPKELLDRHQALQSVAKTAATVFHWDADHPHPYLSIQGVMFSVSPETLAAKETSFDQLRDRYSVSHPVRDVNP